MLKKKKIILPLINKCLYLQVILNEKFKSVLIPALL